MDISINTSGLPSNVTPQNKIKPTEADESFEVVARAFEKMVFDKAFAFTPLINEQDSKLALSQKNSIVNDLFKDELHKQSQGSLMSMFLNDYETDK